MTLNERRLEPLAQRLRRLVDALGNRRWVKRQRVYLVEAGELRLKRIEMTDAHRAATKEASLHRLAGLGVLPRPVARHHADLWVEYLEGAPVRSDDPDLPERFADLLAALYGTDPSPAPIGDRFGLEPLAMDLDILRRAGVLTRDGVDAILPVAEALAPREVWLGFDHTDLLLKNMLRRADGSLCLIDVESVVDGEAIGTGFAKAAWRWMGSRREDFVAAARRREAIPNFFAYLPYLEIRFLAAWTKRSLLLGKSKLVEPAAFPIWLERHRAARR